MVLDSLRPLVPFRKHGCPCPQGPQEEMSSRPELRCSGRDLQMLSAAAVRFGLESQMQRSLPPHTPPATKSIASYHSPLVNMATPREDIRATPAMSRFLS